MLILLSRIRFSWCFVYIKRNFLKQNKFGGIRKMKFISSRLPYIAAGTLALAVGLTAVSVFGQETTKSKTISETVTKGGGFCNNNNWSSDERVWVNELREMTVA